MKKGHIFATVSAVTLGVCTLAMAEGRMMMQNDHYWYAGAGMLVNDSINLNNLQNGSLNETNDNRLGGRLFVGYEVNHWFGVELGGERLGNVTATSYNALGRVQDTATFKYWVFDLDAVGKVEMPFMPALYAFGKVGPSLVHQNASAGSNLTNFLTGIGPGPIASSTTTRGAFNYGAGLGLAMANGFGFRAGYTGYNTFASNSNSYLPAFWDFDLTYRFPG